MEILIEILPRDIVNIILSYDVDTWWLTLGLQIRRLQKEAYTIRENVVYRLGLTHPLSTLFNLRLVTFKSILCRICVNYDKDVHPLRNMDKLYSILSPSHSEEEDEKCRHGYYGISDADRPKKVVLKKLKPLPKTLYPYQLGRIKKWNSGIRSMIEMIDSYKELNRLAPSCPTLPYWRGDHVIDYRHYHYNTERSKLHKKINAIEKRIANSELFIKDKNDLKITK